MKMIFTLFVSFAWATHGYSQSSSDQVGFDISTESVTSALAGEWEGTFDTQNGGQRRYVGSLQVSGNLITGALVEKNPDQNPQPTYLIAIVRGTIQGQTILFDKTYNGIGGRNHTVKYEGMFDAATGSLSGIYRLGNLQGNFSMGKL